MVAFSATHLQSLDGASLKRYELLSEQEFVVGEGNSFLAVQLGGNSRTVIHNASRILERVVRRCIIFGWNVVIVFGRSVLDCLERFIIGSSNKYRV